MKNSSFSSIKEATFSALYLLNVSLFIGNLGCIESDQSRRRELSSGIFLLNLSDPLDHQPTRNNHNNNWYDCKYTKLHRADLSQEMMKTALNLQLSDGIHTDETLETLLTPPLDLSWPFVRYIPSSNNNFS